MQSETYERRSKTIITYHKKVQADRWAEDGRCEISQVWIQLGVWDSQSSILNYSMIVIVKFSWPNGSSLKITAILLLFLILSLSCVCSVQTVSQFLINMTIRLDWGILLASSTQVPLTESFLHMKYLKIHMEGQTRYTYDDDAYVVKTKQ